MKIRALIVVLGVAGCTSELPTTSEASFALDAGTRTLDARAATTGRDGGSTVADGGAGSVDAAPDPEMVCMGGDNTRCDGTSLYRVEYSLPATSVDTGLASFENDRPAARQACARWMLDNLTPLGEHPVLCGACPAGTSGCQPTLPSFFLPSEVVPVEWNKSTETWHCGTGDGPAVFDHSCTVCKLADGRPCSAI